MLYMVFRKFSSFRFTLKLFGIFSDEQSSFEPTPITYGCIVRGVYVGHVLNK